MIENEQLQTIMRRCMALPEDARLDPDDEQVLRQHADSKPYFAAISLILLRHGNLTEAETNTMRQHLALTCSDRRTLAFAAHGEEWSRFYPSEEKDTPKETNDVIDTFLRTYGSCSPEEEALLEKMIFNPTPDYAGMLAREEQENLPAAQPNDDDISPDSQDARINAFILSQHPATHKPKLLPDPEPIMQDEEEAEKAPVSHPEHTDDSLLSESLAKIFIKRGRYERAYEIISGLNLKFPKKSAYFADQLRFLQKLIINQRLQEQQKGSSDAPEK